MFLKMAPQHIYQKEVIFPYEVHDNLFLNPRFFSCDQDDFIYVLDCLLDNARKVPIKGIRTGVYNNSIKTTKLDQDLYVFDGFSLSCYSKLNF